MTTAQRTGTFDDSFAASEEGLTVYDTDLNCYFLFDGSNWQRFAMGLNTDDQNISGSGLSGTTLTIGIEDGTNETVDLSSLVDWKLTGNSGTTPGTNFIGTTDAKDLVFKVNNTERFRMTQKGQLYTNSSTSVLIGNGAGDSDDLSDNQNTIIGYQAGQNSTSYGNNTLLGYKAGITCDGGYNTFIGWEAGSGATNSTENVFIGRWAGWNYDGHGSVLIGKNALGNSCSSLGNNVAIGYEAGTNGDTEESILIGYQAGFYTTSTSHDVFIGTSAGEDSDGSSNIAIGSSAADDFDGDYNVCIGSQSASGTNYTGNNNTLIGASTTFSGGTTFSNSSALGFGSAPSASNRIHLGNSSVAWIGGQVAWSTYSDKRIKNNIKENVSGLDFIMKLRPVTYNLDVDKQNEIRGIVNNSDYPEKYENNSTVFTGFIAQEVEQAANDCNYDFNGVQPPANDKDLYSLRYAEFVVPLVKAMQEQQEQIKQLQKQIQQQQETINSLINN